MYPYLEIGGRYIMNYDIMQWLGIIIGIIVCCLYLYKIAKMKNPLDILKVIISGVICIVVIGIIFSHAVRILDTFGIMTPAKFFDAMVNDIQGNHFVGRLLSVFLFCPAIIHICFKSQQDRAAALNGVALFIVVMHFFSRIGCFLNGCCYGINYSGIGAVVYTQGDAFMQRVTYPVFPSQLLEAAGCVIIFIWLFCRLHKKKNIFYPMIVGMSCLFLISECFMDKRGSVLLLGLSAIQYTALFLIGVTVLLMLFLKFRKSRENK